MDILASVEPRHGHKRRAIDRQPQTRPEIAIHPLDVANIFYTSGSTGVPKGAMVEQRGMLNHLLAKVELLKLTSDSRVAQTASHGFDISIWQLLAPLVVGGQAVIYDNDTVLDPVRFINAITQDRVTVVETVPTLLDALSY